MELEFECDDCGKPLEAEMTHRQRYYIVNVKPCEHCLDALREQIETLQEQIADLEKEK